MDDVVTNCTPEGTIVNGFDGIGRRTSMAVGSQMTNSYTWDDANELTLLSSALGSASLTYTPDAQRETLVVNNGTNVTTSYSYDPASERLNEIKYSSSQNPSLGTISYSYDADGRVVGKSGSFATLKLPAASSTPAAYASTNQIQTWLNGNAPSVDLNNSLTSDPVSGAGYSWNAKDELLKAGTDSYTYDAGGRREIVNSSSATISYLYDGSTPVQITTTPSGGGPGVTGIMAMPDSNEILSVGRGAVRLHDARGSTVGGVASTGSLVFQYSYDPYGNFSASGTPPSGYGNVYAMAGIENDPSGLYHANARYYSPALTRFLSEDPERGKANMFTYAGENAITGSDVSGMDDCGDDCGGDLSGAQGGANGGGFLEVLQFLLSSLFNSFQSSSSAAPTIMNFTGPQLKAQFGSSFVTLGLDRNRNVYTEGGVLLIEDEEEELPGSLEAEGQREIANNTSEAIIRQFLRGATFEKDQNSVQLRKQGGFSQANEDFDRITSEWGLGARTTTNGVRTSELPNGTTVSVRPFSTEGSPTIQINVPGERPLKIRY